MSPAAVQHLAARAAELRAAVFGTECRFRGLTLRLAVASREELRVLESGGYYPERVARVRLPVALVRERPAINETLTVLISGSEFVVRRVVDAPEASGEWICELSQP